MDLRQSFLNLAAQVLNGEYADGEVLRNQVMRLYRGVEFPGVEGRTVALTGGARGSVKVSAPVSSTADAAVDQVPVPTTPSVEAESIDPADWKPYDKACPEKDRHKTFSRQSIACGVCGGSKKPSEA